MASSSGQPQSRSAPTTSGVLQDGMGQVAAAAAFRAKYSRKDLNGKVQKVRLRIEHLGVHPKNRGGVYPSGLRCKALGTDVLDVGFNKEELANQLVVVEETPEDQIRSRGKGYISGSSHNRDQSRNDELLCTCFD